MKRTILSTAITSVMISLIYQSNCLKRGITVWLLFVFISGICVAQPTVITSQPSNVTACAGNNTSFSVVTTGTVNGYNWQVSTNNGTSYNTITAAGSNPTYSGWNTATLTLTGLSNANNGYKYRCVISGSILTTYNANNTGPAYWTCPVGTTSVLVECMGGGGGGAGQTPMGYNLGGGGGGGGAYASATISVIPNTEYSILLGTGGAGGNGYNKGDDGQDSYFQNGFLTGVTVVLAKGGKGGEKATPSTPSYGGNGGLGGLSSNCIGTIKYSGGNGANGNGIGPNPYGGGGGGAANNNSNGSSTSNNIGAIGGWNGGNGGNGAINNCGSGGNSYNFYGIYSGGGGGGALENGACGGNGGNGGAGRLLLTYQFLGNINSQNAILTINSNPTITPSGSTILCNGSNVTLTASSGTTYLWSTGATTQSINVSTIGNYIVTVTNVSGCSGVSAPTTVTVNSLSSVSINSTGNTTFCAGDNVLLKCNATGSGLTYQWKKGNNNINGATASTYSASSTGNYKCVVTNACGTATSNAIAVTALENASVTLTATGATSFCAGDSVTLNASNPGANYSLQWYRNNISLLGATALSYVAKQPGTYKVVSKNNVTGCSRINTSNVSTNVNCRMAEPNQTSGTIDKDPSVINPINLFPNPNSGSFTFEYTGLSEEENGTAVIKLYNSEGQMVYEYTAEVENGSISKELNLTNTINNGIYFLKMDFNNQIYKSKVIIN